MIRRARFKMAPNVAAKSNTKPPTNPVNAEPKKKGDEKKETEVETAKNTNNNIEECENQDEHERIVIIDEPAEFEEQYLPSSTARSQEDNSAPSPSPQSEVPPSEMSDAVTCDDSQLRSRPVSSTLTSRAFTTALTSAGVMSSPPRPQILSAPPLQQPSSVIGSSQYTAAASAPPQPPPKRKRRRDEELNVKEFTLADLIDWTPKTENTLRKKWNENRKKMLEMGGADGGKLGVNDRASLGPPEKKEAVGPRVKINEKGEMVLDEESLVVRDDPNSLLVETVDDDLLPKKLNSMSFRKRNYRRGAKWTELETEMFYEVLSATGTDFGIMHEFVQSRTRLELKKKFNYEERANCARIAQAFDNPTLLDESLIERVERLRTRIEKDLEERIAAAEQARLARRERGRPPRKGTRRENSADEREFQAREQKKREHAEVRQAKRRQLKAAVDVSSRAPRAVRGRKKKAQLEDGNDDAPPLKTPTPQTE